MMRQLSEFQVVDGAVTETYTVSEDDDAVMIRQVLDAHTGTPVDTLYVNRKAIPQLLAALHKSTYRPPVEDISQLVVTTLYRGSRTKLVPVMPGRVS